MKRKLLPVALGALALITAGCVSTKQPENEAQAVKIGYIVPLTGTLASVGADLANAVTVATEEMNALQTKYVFEAVLEDDACRPENTVKSYDKLVKQDGVKFIGGPTCSSPFLSVSPKAETDKVLLLSGSATQADITNAGDYSFRVVPSDALQGVEGAAIAKAKGWKKAAVLYVNNDYGKGLADTFASGLEGDIVLTDSLEQDGADFRTQLTKVKGSDAEFLYVVAYPKEGGVLLKQAKELGLSLPIVAAEGMKDAETINVAGDGAEGVLFTVPAANTDSYNQAFAAAYQAKFGAEDEPGIYAAEYYDVAMLLMKTIADAGNDAEAVKTALYATKNYPGASGMITFDENGDVVGKTYDRLEVKNGEFVKAESGE